MARLDGKAGVRRATLQASLNQCEQFLDATGNTGYATRPVQLFYALSQAGLAIVAASPRTGNQAWQVISDFPRSERLLQL